MSRQGTGPSRGELIARAEAAAWITRLHGPSRTPEMEEGLRRWLEERPENGREFEGLTDVWDLASGNAVPSHRVPRLERWEHSAEAHELAEIRALLGMKHRSREPPRKRWLAAAVMVLALIGIVAIIGSKVSSDSTYITGIGEQRTVQLDDGTRVSLNSGSELSVDYDKAERRVILVAGEALFEVAKRADWPFVVVAGDQEVTALGTSFVVRKDQNRTAITLIEGRVSVLSRRSDATPSARPLAPSVLSPGQRLTVAGAAAPKLDRPPVEAVTAWRRGEVALDDTSLAQAVAEMNRHDKLQIVIAAPGIDSIVVSGLYHTGDNRGFAQSVAAMYRLKMTERDGQIVLER